MRAVEIQVQPENTRPGAWILPRDGITFLCLCRSSLEPQGSAMRDVFLSLLAGTVLLMGPLLAARADAMTVSPAAVQVAIVSFPWLSLTM